METSICSFSAVQLFDQWIGNAYCFLQEVGVMNCPLKSTDMTGFIKISCSTENLWKQLLNQLILWKMQMKSDCFRLKHPLFRKSRKKSLHPDLQPPKCIEPFKVWHHFNCLLEVLLSKMRFWKKYIRQWAGWELENEQLLNTLVRRRNLHNCRNLLTPGFTGAFPILIEQYDCTCSRYQ